MIRAFIGGFIAVFVFIVVFIAFAVHHALFWGVATAFAFVIGLGLYDGLTGRANQN